MKKQEYILVVISPFGSRAFIERIGLGIIHTFDINDAQHFDELTAIKLNNKYGCGLWNIEVV